MSAESNIGTLVSQSGSAEISTQLVAISDTSFGSAHQLLYTFLITNTSSNEIDLRNGVIQFITPFHLENVEGDFGTLSWPTNKIFVSERHPKGYRNSLTFAYSAEPPQLGDEHTILKPGASIQLSFDAPPLGIELEDVRTSLKLLLDPSPQMKVGQLLIKTPLPKEALFVSQSPSVEVFGEEGFHQQIMLDWGQTHIIDQLPYGDYSIHTNSLEYFPGGTDQHVALTRSSPSASLLVDYEHYVDTTRLTITMPQKPVSANIQKKIYLQNLTRGGLPQTKRIVWGKDHVLNNLIMGHRYRLWADGFTYNGTKYLPNITHKRPYEFTADNNAVDQFSLQYVAKSELSKTMVPVLIEVRGLPLGARPILSLKDKSTKRVYQYPISHAETTVFNVVPGKYVVQGSVYTVNKNKFLPAISLKEVDVNEGSVSKISVIYKKVK
ncbi:hypothetical protein [Zooshikella sp. RANM57]|uniref:hypothetical protein n=1 Tax=Zooshikella sp. RANM57 TaxID=3425863 RepID=UPI003D6E1EB8